MLSKLLVVYDIDTDELRNRLADCQVYSDKINESILLGEKIKEDNKLNLFEVLHLIKKRTDTIVTFQCILQNKINYVFSNFFSLKDALNFVPYFFADKRSTLIMICEKEQKGVYVELSMGGSVLVRFQVHEDDMITRDDNWWNSLLVPYIELTSVSSVKEALKMTFTIFGLNDGEIMRYLDSNCVFKDEYII